MHFVCIHLCFKNFHINKQNLKKALNSPEEYRKMRARIHPKNKRNKTNGLVSKPKIADVICKEVKMELGWTPF